MEEENLTGYEAISMQIQTLREWKSDKESSKVTDEAFRKKLEHIAFELNVLLKQLQLFHQRLMEY